MNLYLRYFDREILVKNVDEAIRFLSDIDEIEMNPQLERDIREYVKSDVYYPKRYKIRPRIYFIIIKTEAQTMQDFKDKKALHAPATNQRGRAVSPAVAELNAVNPGWYEGMLNFKRVVLIPGTGKFRYTDTRFVARCKAESGIDCYNRILDHLQQCVDNRSQFPSAKGKNFSFRFLGLTCEQVGKRT